MARLPRKASGRRNRFFETEGMDELVAMVLELTAEVSTLRQRLYVTERVLEGHGLAIGEQVEAWQPTERDERIMAEERERLLATVLRTLESPEPEAEAQAEPQAEPSDDARPGETRVA